jgi:hypothetical protein
MANRANRKPDREQPAPAERRLRPPCVPPVPLQDDWLRSILQSGIRGAREVRFPDLFKSEGYSANVFVELSSPTCLKKGLMLSSF